MPSSRREKADARTAWNEVQRALQRGKIAKPPACQTCDRPSTGVGRGGHLCAHHWRGYEHPLDVWWVCTGCNVRLHVHDGSMSLEQARAALSGRGSVGVAHRKVDNHDLAAKLDLRRYFLDRYHTEGPIDVLDCCQGEGLLWGRLRREYTLTSYWGVDTAPKKGRLRIDSARLLQLPGWPQNVVDVDTYGMPWKHWLALLGTLSRPTTVFLTVGRPPGGGTGSGAGTTLSREEVAALGLSRIYRNVPRGLSNKLSSFATSLILSRCCCEGILLVEAAEARSDGNARYLGVRLEPRA